MMLEFSAQFSEFQVKNQNFRRANANFQNYVKCSVSQATDTATGNPLPKDIEQICHWLLNESFTTSFHRIFEIKTRKGLALVDIVIEVTMFVFKIKMPPDVRIHLINEMAEIEYRLSLACNDKLQLG